MMDKYSGLIPNNPLKAPPDKKIENWIAFDFEWIDHNSDISPIYKTDKYASGSSEPPVFNKDEYSEIVTFGFEDSYGNKNSFDISDYSSSKEFLEAIKEKILQYKYCFAWGSKAVIRKNDKTGELEGINGDLVVLDSNLKKNRIPSIVNFNEFSGIPYIKKDIFTIGNSVFIADIDLLNVFTKPLVRLIFKNKYKSLHLDEVCRALLDIGKLDNKTGAKLEETSIEERKSYCIHDAHLVAELVRIKNGDIMKIMQLIAFHTRLRFEEVCHRGMPWIWKSILNQEIYKKINILGYANLPSVLKKLYSNKQHLLENSDKYTEGDYEEDDEYEELLEHKENSYVHYIELLEQKQRELNSEDTFVITNGCSSNQGRHSIGIKKTNDDYKGGLIIPPIRGLHNDVFVFDITSLYPTMIINHNLSPETVNCSCCKVDPKAKLIFGDEFVKDFLHTKNDSGYWVCLRRKGLLSNKLKELTQIRIQYKKEGKELESVAIKAIINSGYGVFGDPYFKYYDPMVAELVTALGRQTLLGMQKIAKELNFKVLYGDTDSLFVNGVLNRDDISKFINTCKTKLNVEVNHEVTFKKLILVSKKHYVGFPSGDNKDPIIKGMEGIKSDRPKFIQTAFRDMVEDIENDINPILKLRQRFKELDRRQIPKERLAISMVLTKNPKDYTHDDKQKRLGTKLGLKKGDTLTYYKCDKQESFIDTLEKEKARTVSESDNPDDISYSKYKESLLYSVKDVVEILGYNVEMDLLPKKKWSNLGT